MIGHESSSRMMTLSDIEKRRAEIAANPLFYCNKCQYTGPTSAHGKLSIRGLSIGCNYSAADCNWREIAALDSLAEALKELERWKKAVEGLTPLGSEFIDDPERCAAWIKRDSYMELRRKLNGLIGQCAMKGSCYDVWLANQPKVPAKRSMT